MIASTRNPFETLIVAAFGLYCVTGLVAFDSVATTTLRGYPVPFGHVFLAVGLVTCSVALTGIIRAATVKGVLWERAGLTGLAGVGFAYGCWGVGTTGVRALAFCLFLFAMAAAAAWRAVQISRARKVALT